MPPADIAAKSPHERLRVLAYGKAKTKKTWWAAQAAEAGFNVILIDGDDGAHIVRNIRADAQARIQIVNVVDTLDRPVFCDFMARMLAQRANNEVIWNEVTRAAQLPTTKANPEHSYYVIDVRKFTANDVLVIDSWSALVDSLMMRFAVEQKIDLADAKKTEWEGYGFSGRLATFFLAQLHALPCHVVVISHESVYEKKKNVDKGNGRIEQIVEYTRTQPVSTSNPHAMQLAKHFSDVLHFTQVNELTYKINAGGEQYRDGGSRNVPPRKYNWPEGKDSEAELSFARLVQALGYALPENVSVSAGCRWYAPGDDSFSLASKVPPRTPTGPTPLTGGAQGGNVAVSAAAKPAGFPAFTLKQKENPQ
jgi:hypothetical protein